jgi:glycosyltransferase involved in cell wall biosynthesis
MYPSPGNPSSGVFVKDQVDSLRGLGLDVDVFFVDGPKNRLNYPLGFLRLWKHLARNRYDLLHPHYVYSGLVARAQWRHPVVLTHHGLEVFMVPRQAALCRRVTPWFDQVIVMSEEMKAGLGYPGAHVIPCGVDMESFRPAPRDEARAALGLSQEKKLVLWAGDPRRPEKRFDLVEAATTLLRQEDPSVELVLLAGKPHGDVSAYMNACDVLVLASDGEGSPMVVKEAMACNLPVVATPRGDVPQLIGDDPGSHICTQDPEDIAAKVRGVLDERRRTRGRAAVQHLGLEEIARRIVGVYEQALDGDRKTEAREPASLASRGPSS